VSFHPPGRDCVIGAVVLLRLGYRLLIGLGDIFGRFCGFDEPATVLAEPWQLELRRFTAGLPKPR
jgi:hypothetical protein